MRTLATLAGVSLYVLLVAPPSLLWTVLSRDVRFLYVCGGGAGNGQLMRTLTAALPDRVVATTDRLGLHPQAVEATAFAWLARQRVKREAGNLASVTGASGPRVLGALHVARRGSAGREG